MRAYWHALAPALIGTLLISPVPASADVDYQRDIKPLLHEKCSACHGALKQEAELRFDAAALIRDSQAVVSGQAEKSDLIERVSSADPDLRMPPEGEGEKLTDEQIQLLKQWINEGLSAPDDEPIPSRPEDHWAYQLPQSPAGLEASSVNPIDQLILRTQQQAGVKPLGPASKHNLVRRLYFDLIGLPPTPQQVAAFVNNDSADAYQSLVNELLNSPRHGERWARHWMDVWRYSDWSGYKNQLRGSQRHIWHWRDWIIESINEDKAYNRMVVEMIAGDELAPQDPQVLRATGFLARNYHNSNRNIWLDATVEHTSKAFLATTINCARCHDHKYDPLTQHEYYAMRAIFEPHHVRTFRLPGQPNLNAAGIPRVYDSQPEAKTFLYIAGNEKHYDKESPVAAALPAVFQSELNSVPVSLPAQAIFPALKPYVEAEAIKQAQDKLTKLEQQPPQATKDSQSDEPSIVELKREETRQELLSLHARWAADKALYGDKPLYGDKALYGVQQAPSTAPNELAQPAAAAERRYRVAKAKRELAEKQQQLASVTTNDNEDEKKQETAIKNAEKAVENAEQQLTKATNEAKKTDAKYSSVGKAYPKQSTGRRFALANWIASEENPLTARVAVNHLWRWHFGQALVENTFDFGLRSPPPQQQQVLDFLATELTAHNWSMKHVHRLIVTSDAYQRASSSAESVAESNRQLDPENKFYWRANVRRLEAEAIRDSVLHIAGSLDTTTGGPDLDHSQGQTKPRRSLYFRHAYEKQMTMLVLFDGAGPNECYRRSNSIVPQQALSLANSNLAWSQARKLAGQLVQDAKDSEADDSFIALAFKTILGRQATSAEITACQEFLSDQTELLKGSTRTLLGGTAKADIPASSEPEQRAKENLVHALINHNDFITVR